MQNKSDLHATVKIKEVYAYGQQFSLRYWLKKVNICVVLVLYSTKKNS